MGLGYELRHALRRLVRAPGFSLLSIATLALAIGATTAVFSLVDGVLLKPLPFRQPDRLVQVSSTKNGRPTATSLLDFFDYRTRSKTVVSMAAASTGAVNLTGAGDSVRVQRARVSAVWFGLFGVAPRLGRDFAADEDQPGATPVAILSDALFRGRFGGDPQIVGRSLQINGKSVTVVGVAAPGFDWPDEAELWMPLSPDKDELLPDNRGGHYLQVYGRLASSVSPTRAADELRRIGDALSHEYPNSNALFSATVQPLLDALVGTARPGLLALFFAVALVLIIACANVANLMLVRAAGREGELAVRLALGAGPRRLLRELLLESVLLSIAAALVGAALAAWAVDALVAVGPAELPRLAHAAVDRRALFFAIAAASISGAIFGLIPGLHAARADVAQVLRQSGPGATSFGGARTRAVLVTLEVALAIVLLAGAGLLLESLTHLLRVDPGIRPDHVFTFRVALPDAKYPTPRSQREMVERTMESMRQLPGADAAAASLSSPFTRRNFGISYEVDGRPKLPPGNNPVAEVRPSTPDFFRALDLRLLRGRLFDQGDRRDRPQVAVVNEAFVRQTFPGEEPIGKRITLGWGMDGDEGKGEIQAGGEIVGVVKDVRQMGLSRPPPPMVYLPFAQAPVGGFTVLVHSAASPALLETEARRRMREIDADLPIFEVRPLTATMAGSIEEPRFFTLVLAGFSALALLLAAMGVYGVISYSVVQRTRELGIRFALGATAGGVLRLVLRQGMAMVALGACIGIAAAAGVTRFMRSLLFEVAPADPLALAASCAVLCIVAAIACWLPARRATRVDPLVAMKAE
jgi:predicted permease